MPVEIRIEIVQNILVQEAEPKQDNKYQHKIPFALPR